MGISQTRELARNLSLHMGHLIEATTDEELPEQILCSSILHNLDPNLAKKIN